MALSKYPLLIIWFKHRSTVVLANLLWSTILFRDAGILTPGAEALKGKPAAPFRVPPGLRLVRVDPETGRLAEFGDKRAIWEAYLPGTEPGAEPEIPVLGGGVGLAPGMVDPGAPLNPDSDPGLSGLDTYTGSVGLASPTPVTPTLGAPAPVSPLSATGEPVMSLPGAQSPSVAPSLPPVPVQPQGLVPAPAPAPAPAAVPGDTGSGGTGGLY